MVQTIINEMEEILDTAKLREFAKGENGELISLVDIQHTKSLLQTQSDKYKNLVITEDNYKKEGAAAERELRESRLALSKIHTSNKSILNKAKKDDKDAFDTLIKIVQPQEIRLKKEIDFIKDKVEREKKEKEERELKKAEEIKNKLEKAKEDFNSKITKGRVKEDLVNYNKSLDELELIFSEFGALEFEAKRIHAVFTGRRGELEKQIKDFEELESGKKEAEAKKKKEEEMKNQILEIRISELIEKGFEHVVHLSVLKNEFSEITEIELKAFTELDWFNKKKEFIEIEQESSKKKEKELSIKWDSVIASLKSINVDVSMFQIKQGQLITSKQVEELKELLELEKKKVKVNIAKSVLKEIDPFKNEILNFVSSFDKKIKNKKFKQEKSKELMNNLIDSIEKSVNEILGSEINK